MPIVLVTPTVSTSTYTSGTIGDTVIDTASVLEHAFRRVKVHPAQQTPELVQIAKDNLYLLLMNLANRGLNLWAVESQFVGLQTGQSVYQCPVGTIDLLNLVYSQPTRATGTDTTTSNSITTEFTSATTITRFGVKMSSVQATEMMTLYTSSDGISFTAVETFTRTDWAADTWFWFPLDPSVSAQFFRVAFNNNATFTEFYLATTVYDLPVTQWNRDTWSVINNKTQLGKPATSYYFEKLIRPQVTVWPVPNNDYDHLTMFIHRQIQDVGGLSQALEIPARWFEAVVWQLASRLVFEVPGVDPSLAPTIVQMADKYMLEVEEEETDGAPIYLTPGIGVYSR